jgi:hypothetical protein
MTAVAYGYAGLYTVQSFSLIPWIVPSILLGVPLGAYVIRQVGHETFRRICMSFDAWVVAFGMSRLLNELRLVEGGSAYLLMVIVAAIDIWLLYRFFTNPALEAALAGEPPRAAEASRPVDTSLSAEPSRQT